MSNYKTVDGSLLKYYVVYKKDSSKNFFVIAISEGDMLDHVMEKEDGDLANYEIYLQII